MFSYGDDEELVDELRSLHESFRRCERNVQGSPEECGKCYACVENAELQKQIDEISSELDVHR